jgi:hypothetical protein
VAGFIEYSLRRIFQCWLSAGSMVGIILTVAVFIFIGILNWRTSVNLEPKDRSNHDIHDEMQFKGKKYNEV